MILGNRCSRGCRFCAVKAGAPLPVEPREADEVAIAASELGLSHVVVTSVTRDDIPDGGASHFASVIRTIRDKLPNTTVEVLTPDFQGDSSAISAVIEAGPHVFNHNVETVPSLYADVRPNADYERSLAVLSIAAELADEQNADIKIKSGLMVGFGETDKEVMEVMDDLKSAGCGIVTIGQYLQPSRGHHPVKKFYRPEEYQKFEEHGRHLGLTVFAGPLVRSSYLADRVYEGL